MKANEKKDMIGSIEVRDNDIWNGVLCYFATCCCNFVQLEISLYLLWIALIREIGIYLTLHHMCKNAAALQTRFSNQFISFVRCSYSVNSYQHK